MPPSQVEVFGRILICFNPLRVASSISTKAPEITQLVWHRFQSAKSRVFDFAKIAKRAKTAKAGSGLI